jgi:nucleoside-diphosphate-sugar epimerase
LVCSRLVRVNRIEALLITGSNGFVGRSFLKFLETLPVSDLPQQICLVSRTEKFPDVRSLELKTKVLFVTSDLEKPWEFTFPATHIAHFAADGSKDAYSIDAAQKFLSITRNLENWIVALNCPTIFLASSGACFGYVPLSGEVYTPDRETNNFSTREKIPENKAHLIQSRIQAEDSLLLLESLGKIDLRIGRLFSFIGNSLFNKHQYAVNSFVNMALSSSEIEVLGDPRTIRSYLSEYDMANWIYKSLCQKINSKYLAIGSANPVTILELANEVSAQTGAKVCLPKLFEPGDIYVANSLETQKLLNVTETISWQNALERYITFSREIQKNAR